MKHSENIELISKALLAAQKATGAATKGATNPFFHSKYADLGSVMEACKDAFNDNEITILQPVMGEFIETILIHTSGQWISSKTPIMLKEKQWSKELGKFVELGKDPQALGSAITYARRYGLQSMLFIPAEDDDGERAMSRNSYVKPTTAPTDENQDKCPVCGTTTVYHAKTCPNFKAPKGDIV